MKRIGTSQKIGWLIASVIWISVVFSAAEAFAVDWQELKGEHFIVYVTQKKDNPKEILERAEVYYRQIATDLGYPRYSQFWLWDKRVKIYIYPDKTSFLKATGQPTWSEGMADYRKKEIASYAGSRDFLDSILPHEMAHLIFRDFVGFQGEVPLWLDEGVAQWAESRKRQEAKAMVRDLAQKDSVLSFEDLMKLEIRYIDAGQKVYLRHIRTAKGEKGLLFMSGENLIKTYYLQSVSVVGFLIEKYGSFNFAAFCRELRDGKSLEDAVRSAYPAVHSLNELEDRWKEYLNKGA